MKIAQVCQYTAPAKDSMGAERVLESLSRGLVEKGHEVSLIINSDSVTKIAPVVSEIPDDINIVHYHGGFPEDYGHEQIHPWITTNHGGGYDTPQSYTEQQKNHIVAISKFVADNIGLEHYVHNCIDFDDFNFCEKKDNYFLWMGGTDWEEQKGLFSTIRIAKKLGLNLKIAGAGKNQAVINEIKLHCNKKIEYLGTVNGKEKAELLSHARAVFAIGEILDAFCLVNVEALASGTPVIARNIGAHKEILNKEISFLCENEKDICLSILNCDKIDYWKCKEYAVSNFSKGIIADKYLNVYQEIINANYTK